MPTSLTFAFLVTDVDGAVTVDSPDPTNATNQVNKTTIVNPGGFDITPTSLSMVTATQTLTFQLYSPAAGISLTCGLMDADDVLTVVTVLTTVENAWETVSCDFNVNKPKDQFTRSVANFSIRFGTRDAMFYWAPPVIITKGQAEQLPGPASPPTDYVTDYEGAVTIDSVDPTNAENQVKKTTIAGSNSSIMLTLPVSQPIDLVNQNLTLRLYSPAAGIALFCEILNTENVKLTADAVSTTVANQWETITFKFTGTMFQLAKVFLAFNSGSGSAFYWYEPKITVMKAPVETKLSVFPGDRSISLEWSVGPTLIDVFSTMVELPMDGGQKGKFGETMDPAFANVLSNVGGDPDLANIIGGYLVCADRVNGIYSTINLSMCEIEDKCYTIKSINGEPLVNGRKYTVQYNQMMSDGTEISTMSLLCIPQARPQQLNVLSNPLVSNPNSDSSLFTLTVKVDNPNGQYSQYPSNISFILCQVHEDPSMLFNDDPNAMGGIDYRDDVQTIVMPVVSYANGTEYVLKNVRKGHRKIMAIYSNKFGLSPQSVPNDAFVYQTPSRINELVVESGYDKKVPFHFKTVDNPNAPINKIGVSLLRNDGTEKVIAVLTLSKINGLVPTDNTWTLNPGNNNIEGKGYFTHENFDDVTKSALTTPVPLSNGVAYKIIIVTYGDRMDPGDVPDDRDVPSSQSTMSSCVTGKFTPATVTFGGEDGDVRRYTINTTPDDTFPVVFDVNSNRTPDNLNRTKIVASATGELVDDQYLTRGLTITARAYSIIPIHLLSAWKHPVLVSTNTWEHTPVTSDALDIADLVPVLAESGQNGVLPFTVNTSTFNERTQFKAIGVNSINPEEYNENPTVQRVNGTYLCFIHVSNLTPGVNAGSITSAHVLDLYDGPLTYSYTTGDLLVYIMSDTNFNVESFFFNNNNGLISTKCNFNFEQLSPTIKATLLTKDGDVVEGVNPIVLTRNDELLDGTWVLDNLGALSGKASFSGLSNKTVYKVRVQVLPISGFKSKYTHSYGIPSNHEVADYGYASFLYNSGGFPIGYNVFIPRDIDTAESFPDHLFDVVFKNKLGETVTDLTKTKISRSNDLTIPIDSSYITNGLISFEATVFDIIDSTFAPYWEYPPLNDYNEQKLFEHTAKLGDELRYLIRPHPISELQINERTLSSVTRYSWLSEWDEHTRPDFYRVTVTKYNSANVQIDQYYWDEENKNSDTVFSAVYDSAYRNRTTYRISFNAATEKATISIIAVNGVTLYPRDVRLETYYELLNKSDPVTVTVFKRGVVQAPTLLLGAQTGYTNEVKISAQVPAIDGYLTDAVADITITRNNQTVSNLLKEVVNPSVNYVVPGTEYNDVINATLRSKYRFTDYPSDEDAHFPNPDYQYKGSTYITNLKIESPPTNFDFLTFTQDDTLGQGVFTWTNVSVDNSATFSYEITNTSGFDKIGPVLLTQSEINASAFNLVVRFDVAQTLTLTASVTVNGTPFSTSKSVDFTATSPPLRITSNTITRIPIPTSQNFARFSMAPTIDYAEQFTIDTIEYRFNNFTNVNTYSSYFDIPLLKNWAVTIKIHAHVNNGPFPLVNKQSEIFTTYNVISSTAPTITLTGASRISSTRSRIYYSVTNNGERVTDVLGVVFPSSENFNSTSILFNRTSFNWSDDLFAINTELYQDIEYDIFDGTPDYTKIAVLLVAANPQGLGRFEQNLC